MDSETKLNLKETFPPNDYNQWLQAVKDSLKGADFDKVMKTKTYEGITLKPIYTKADVADLPFTDNQPGTSPYLRGNDPQRFLQQGWLVAQNHDESDLNKLNAELLKELNLGLTAVNLTLKHEDNNRGVVFKNIDDLRTAFAGVDLLAAPLFMQLDVRDDGFLLLLEKYVDEIGVSLADLKAGIGFDPTGEFARLGYCDLPLEDFWQKLVDSVKWASEKAPGIRVLSLDGTVYEAAGASSMQELGFVLSNAIGLIQGLQYSGFTINQLAPLFQVKLSLGSNFFMEIAKIRAFRLLWAEMIKAFGGSESNQKIWIHGKTANFNKSIYDNYVNVLRTGTEGFAGVIGGVDSLEIGHFNQLTEIPDEFSRRIARNQQIILKEEAHFGKVIDPAGGCYYIESLTSELATKAWGLMQDLESMGGMVRCLRAGKIHELIEPIAKARIEAVNKRKDVFVGINMYANPLEKEPVNGSESDVPESSKAVELDKGALPRHRAMEILENLRLSLAKSQANKQVFLLNMGSIAEFKARADFASGFLQVGGFEVISNNGFASVSEAVQAAKASGAKAFCLCSTDDNYINLVPELRKELMGQILILAGYPTDLVESYKQQGINLFIHIRADVFNTLSQLALQMGVNQ